MIWDQALAILTTISLIMTTTKKKIYIAADGFGEELKNAMKAHVESKGAYEVTDYGTDTFF
jgi:hypothetical protein